MSEHKFKTVEQEEVFVLYWKGKPLHVVKAQWCDWNPPKRIYYKRSHAKSGITNLPNFIKKEDVTIVRYIPEKEPPHATK